jgi:hypothetical protein
MTWKFAEAIRVRHLLPADLCLATNYMMIADEFHAQRRILERPGAFVA